MRDLRHSFLVGASIIALLGLTRLATAAESDGSRFDFAFSAGAAYVSLPGVNRFSTTIDNGPFLFLRQFDGTPALQDFGPSVSMHIGSPDFDSRFFGLSHVNFDIGGVWASASDNATTVLHSGPIATGEYLDVLPINGNGIPGSPIFLRFPEAPHQHVTMDFWQVDTAVTLEGPARHTGAGELSFLAGPRFAYQEQDYGATVVDSTGHSGNMYKIDEGISAFFAGPELGFHSVVPLANGADFHVIGRAAALWYTADLGAHQQLQATRFDLDLNGHDTADNVSARFELASGIAVPLANRRVFFTLDSDIVWWSAVPQVVNPSSGPGIDANSHSFSPVHLGSGDMFVAALTAGLKIPLQ